MKDDNGLSIILTYYKGEKYIFACLDSIFQSYQKSKKKLNKQIILVIDSMEDAERMSSTIKERYENEDLLVLVNEKNIGVAKSRNIGLAHAKYNFYTIIDQDDFVKEGYFSSLEQTLDRSFALHIINGVFLYDDQNKEIPVYYLTPSFSLTSILMQTTTIYTPGMVVFNSDYIRKNDAFIDTSDKFKGCDDWAAYLDVIFRLDTVKVKFISDKIFVYRLHDTNYSNNTKEMILSSLSVLDYFRNKYPSNEKSLLRAKQRYQFLYALKIDNLSSVNLFNKFPSIFTFHYFSSVFKRDRMNRVIFRLDRIRKGVK